MKAFYPDPRPAHRGQKPSASELLDWLRPSRLGGVDPDKIENRLPYAGILLKRTRTSPR